MKRPTTTRNRRLFPSLLLAVLFASVLFLNTGCGDDSSEAVVINLQPWGIDFYANAEGRTFMYMVERAFYYSVLRFEKIDNVYDMVGSIYTGYYESLSPYTVSAATGAAEDVLFVTDITAGQQRLLALNPGYVNDVTLDELLYASADGDGSDEFQDLRGIASLALNSSTYRVFLSDADRVWVIDYDVGDKSFRFRHKITRGCFRSLVAPFGLAVDPGKGLLSRPSLYVIDYDQETLFRYTGITHRLTAPTCAGTLKSWSFGSDSFRDPRGVAVLPPQNMFQSPLVVVADAKSTAAGNDRITAFKQTAFGYRPTDLPANFAFYPDAYPFDLAFDPERDLYASYPEAGAVAGPAY